MSPSWTTPLAPPAPAELNYSGSNLSSISPNLLSLPAPCSALLPLLPKHSNHAHQPAGPRRTAKKPQDSPRVPRPLNSFMMYRKEKQHEVLARYPNVDNRDISRIVAEWWNAESDAVKKEFRTRAEKAKKEHMEKYPGYKYRPRKRSNSASSDTKPVALSSSPKGLQFAAPKPFTLLDPMSMSLGQLSPMSTEELYFYEQAQPTGLDVEAVTPEMPSTPVYPMIKMDPHWDVDQYIDSGIETYWQNWQRMSKQPHAFEPGMALADFYWPEM